jgi:hypothetical protein
MPGTAAKKEHVPEPTHDAGTRRGEQMTMHEGREPGRTHTGQSHQQRPAGARTARDATSINAKHEEPIDPRMPKMPPA